MNLFSSQPLKANPAQVEQLKSWLYEVLSVDSDTVISISQLRCHEPNCPPVETVITLMTDPVRQVKLHKSVAEIEPTDLVRAFQKVEESNDVSELSPSE